MERHQAGQEEKLMEVNVEMDSLQGVHPPGGSPADRDGCFKCALPTVMGLIIVALVSGFILHLFIFTPSCNQDAVPLNNTGKISISGVLNKTDEKETYDIFTVDKAATYIIYVWVKFSDVINRDFELFQTLQGKNISIDTKTDNQREVVFIHKVKLAKGSRISIHFMSTCTDSSFRVYEL